MNAERPLPKVFISYKVLDPGRNAWVERLCGDLRAQGIDAGLDVFEVPPGGSFSDYMTRSVREADFVLFIATPEAVRAVESGRGALAFELQIANARKLAAGEDFSIIPIFREGETTSTYLQDHKYLDFRDDDAYQPSLQSLVDWLHRRVSPPPLGVFPEEIELYGRAIMNPAGYYYGRQEPTDVIRALKVMKQFKVLGFSMEGVRDRSTWTGEYDTGLIELDGGKHLWFRRQPWGSWDKPWHKNFFAWTLQWSGEIVIASGRFRSSPIDRVRR